MYYRAGGVGCDIFGGEEVEGSSFFGEWLSLLKLFLCRGIELGSFGYMRD